MAFVSFLFCFVSRFASSLVPTNLLLTAPWSLVPVGEQDTEHASVRMLW